MDVALTIVTLVTSALCMVGGVFLLHRKPRSIAQVFGSILLFSMGLGNVFVPAMFSSGSIADADMLASAATAAFTVSLSTALFVMLIFSYEPALTTDRGRMRLFIGVYLATTAAVCIASAALARSEPSGGGFWFDRDTTLLWTATAVFAMPCAVAIDILAYRSSSHAKQIIGAAAIALVLILAFDVAFQLAEQGSEAWIWMDIALMTQPIVTATLSAMRRIGIVTPVAEPLSKGSKSKYRLVEGKIYVVEEKQPEFSFALFSEILRSRCHDCANDESFECESLDCSKCTLPCPCKSCNLYEGRTRGLVVTRRRPSEIRLEYFIQTTPVIWLTSIPGKDNMDPSKMGLLTEIIADFMQKSENGVVLVEGIEYLVTANDFLKVLRAIDRWSEVAMSRSSRLVLSLDPKAFDAKEIALIERNREIVHPDDRSSVERIFAESAR